MKHWQLKSIQVLTTFVIILTLILGNILIYRSTQQSEQKNDSNLQNVNEFSKKLKILMATQLPIRLNLNELRSKIQNVKYELIRYIVEDEEEAEPLETAIAEMLAQNEIFINSWSLDSSETFEELQGNITILSDIATELLEETSPMQIQEMGEDAKSAVVDVETTTHQINQEVDQKMEILQGQMVTEGRIVIQSTQELGEILVNILQQSLMIMVVVILIIASLQLLLFKMIRIRLEKFINRLKDIAQGEGDLTQNIEISSKDEIGEMATWLNHFMDKLKNTIKSVKDEAIHLSDSTSELSTSTEFLVSTSQGIHQQSIEIGNTSTNMMLQLTNVKEKSEKMTVNMENVNNSISQMNLNIVTVASAAEQASTNMIGINTNLASISEEIIEISNSIFEQKKEMSKVLTSTQSALSLSQEANQYTQNTVTSMQLLVTNANKIGKAVELIDGIASQTNMLALNATIEAASAGEAGKGFAVVASEVKALAQQTSNANREIGDLIKNIRQNTNESLHHTEEVKTVTTKTSAINQSIYEQLEERNNVSEAIKNKIETIRDATQESAIQIKEASEGIKEITISANQISRHSSTSVEEIQQSTDNSKKISTLISSVAEGSTKVNESIQKIQNSIHAEDQKIGENQHTVQELFETANSLKNTISYFKIDPANDDTPAQISD